MLSRMECIVITNYRTDCSTRIEFTGKSGNGNGRSEESCRISKSVLMNRQRHVWIVNYYSTPPEFTVNERHFEICPLFARSRL